MNMGGPLFVLALIAISMVGWIVTTAIRARHGYPPEGERHGSGKRESDAVALELASENRQLKEKVGALEERLKVLERIATDPSRRLSDDIEELR